MRNCLLATFAGTTLLGGCAHRPPDIELPHIQWLAIPVDVTADETYTRISDGDAARLGCKGSTENPICQVGLPNGEESAAFRSEAVRLESHPDLHCRNLSNAMLENLPQVMMYPRALVTEVRGVRYYGVGHSYKSEGRWQIRIARRLGDLNPRSLDQEVRTFRHEMAHTLGASEERLLGWSAEEYAERCR
jgi:hypothetical protein